MTSVFITLLVLSALLVIAWRAEPHLARLLTILDRRTAVLEALHSRPEPLKTDNMPTDLLRWANSETEEWAREQKRQYLADLRDQLGDWKAVRSAIMTEAFNG